MKILGIVLIALGALALIYGGITYTSRDTVLHVGPLQATMEREHNVPVAPIVGILVLLSGVALLVTAAKKG